MNVTLKFALRLLAVTGCFGAATARAAAEPAAPVDPRAMPVIEPPAPPRVDGAQSEAADGSSGVQPTTEDPTAGGAPESESARKSESPDPSQQDGDEGQAEDTVDADGGGNRRVVMVGSVLGPPDSLPRIAGSAHAIGEEELEKFEQDDVHQILSAVPGVYVRGEEGFGLRPNIGLRGANSNRSAKVTLMEDGILLTPAPYAAPAAYYFPLPTRMVGIEVFKGPAAVKHGPNTIGGAINLRTREIPDDPTGFVDLAAGRFGYGKAHTYWGTTYKGFGFAIEGVRVQSKGFAEQDGGGNTGFGKNDTMLKLGYRTPAGRATTHIVELKGGFANEESYSAYLGLSDADFEANPYRRYVAASKDRMTWWRSQAEVSYLLASRNEIELEARGYRHDFDRVWRRLNRFRDGPDLGDLLANPDAGQNAVFFAVLRGEEDSAGDDQALMVVDNDRRYVSQGVVSNLRWRPRWDKWEQDLEVGVRLHWDSIVRNHVEDPYLMISGTMVPEDAPEVPTTRNTGSVFATAFHLHDSITFLDRFTVAPGIRVELIRSDFEDRLADETSDRFDAVPVPGIGLHVKATDWLGVFAGVHRGFSPVAPGQDESIQPEFSVNYEAGLRALWNGLHAEAIGFFNDYSNLTGVCTFSSGCDDTMVNEQFNAGEVFVFGAETMAQYHHRFDSGLGFHVGGRYTYTGSRFRTEFESNFPQFGDVSAGDELAYVPVHVAGGDAGVGGSIWDINARVNYNGAMRDVAGQGPIPTDERIDGFVTLDVSAEVRFLKRFRVYGVLNNATANQYMVSRRPFGPRPGAPLSFMVGLKVHAF